MSAEWSADLSMGWIRARRLTFASETLHRRTFVDRMRYRQTQVGGRKASNVITRLTSSLGLKGLVK